MGLFKVRSNEDREKSQHRVSDESGLLKRIASNTTKQASNKKTSILRGHHSRSPPPATDSETEPTTSDSDTSHEHESRQKPASNRRRSTMSNYWGDPAATASSSSDREEDHVSEYLKKNRHTPTTAKSTSQSRRSKRSARRSKRSSSSGRAAFPSSSSPAPPSAQQHHQQPASLITNFQNAFLTRPPAAINPFSNKGEVYLCEDMATVCDAMKLDLNTQVMLAYYDAKTLEDFCLMAEADLKDMISRARAMRRAIPPLQIRKIEVLREWVQELSKPKDESRLPAWIRLSRPKRSRRKSKKLIPEDWKEEFRRDLPKLKHNLQKKGASLSGFGSFIPSFRSIGMCGLVE
jgi:hypothetical protein